MELMHARKVHQSALLYTANMSHLTRNSRSSKPLPHPLNYNGNSKQEKSPGKRKNSRIILLRNFF